MAYLPRKTWKRSRAVKAVQLVKEIDLTILLPALVLAFIGVTMVYSATYAKAEMSHYHEFDYLVVNDMFEQALEELRDIILAVRSGQTVQPRQIGDKLQQLLA